ncbi:MULTISPECIES: hypothetical protein [unclassified Helicobacter]|uniref:hypothetical protein n=1 Tax=unclassified Helicobacter TaxID=2593540 RepID=UPI000CF062F2|nr:MULTISPECIES: hypothetical protein [unclassified Helicobacter]
MNQEELDALMKAHQEQWDEEAEAMPHSVTHQDIEDDSLKDKENRLQTLQSIALQSQKALEDSDIELKNLQDKNKLINQNIQEILNYAIRHLEIFEKLVLKFPNIKIFDNSFHETQEVIEKIIAIQENSKNSSKHCLNLDEKLKSQKAYHQKINHIMDTTRALSFYIHHLFQDPIDETRLPVFPKQETEDQDNQFDNEIQAIITSFGRKK